MFMLYNCVAITEILKRYIIMQIQKINQTQVFRGNTTAAADSRPENQESKKPRINPHAAIGALAGAMIPVLTISKIKNGKFNFDVFEYGNKAKELAAILTVSTSSILGGLSGGLLSTKDPKDKKAKVKEAVFDISTVAIPTTITTTMLALGKKMKFKGILPKIIAPIIGIGVGMPISQKVAHRVDTKFINKDEPQPERKLKPQDYLVHLDDLFTLVILTGLKIPFLKEGTAEKLLPFIYAWCGHETGSKTAQPVQNERR